MLFRKNVKEPACVLDKAAFNLIGVNSTHQTLESISRGRFVGV